MGCSSSTNTFPDLFQQPIKNCSSAIIRHESKIIQFVQPSSQAKTNESGRNPKKELILKKQEKIKQLKNNKEFIELSIETSYCVNKLLNTLAENQILQDRELKNLLSKNNQALATKKNRYKNLEAREEKMESELKKEMEKNTKPHNKTVPPKYKQSSERVHNKRQDMQMRLGQGANKENEVNQSSSMYIGSDYKSKFNSRIDQFRIEVNGLVQRTSLKY